MRRLVSHTAFPLSGVLAILTFPSAHAQPDPLQAGIRWKDFFGVHYTADRPDADTASLTFHPPLQLRPGREDTILLLIGDPALELPPITDALP